MPNSRQRRAQSTSEGRPALPPKDTASRSYGASSPPSKNTGSETVAEREKRKEREKKAKAGGKNVPVDVIDKLDFSSFGRECSLSLSVGYLFKGTEC